MYLRRARIVNNGPIRNLDLVLPMEDEGTPIPLVIVGANGGGKTNFLSIIADAIFEAAAPHHSDVVAGASSLNRPWFRIVGAATLTKGQQGGYSILQFMHEGNTHFFKEKAGILTAAQASAELDEPMAAVATWPDDGMVKEFEVTKEQAVQIFSSGVYLYFPASRSEAPHWLNRESLIETQFDVSPRFTGRLGRPIYVEHGLDRLKQWILTLFIEVRVDFIDYQKADGSDAISVFGIDNARSQKALWDRLNEILRAILDDQTARFVWTSRRDGVNVRFETSSGPVLPLEALSSGQATLLNIFGTLLRHCDETGTTDPFGVQGICVVDEIDAHMHVDLQYRALPKLVKLFPRVQFIVSCHSPLLVLGMEREFAPAGVSFFDLPSGDPVQAEAYVEFERALAVLRDTKAFSRHLLDVVGDSTGAKPLVLVEGETDPVYLTAAAELLGRVEVLDGVDVEWIGAKHPRTGQAFNTGKDSLHSLVSALQANPGLVKRPVLVLYDNDARKPDGDYGHLSVRSMPTNPQNSVVTAGVENLLLEESISPEFFDVKSSTKPNGTRARVETLNKMKLCSHLCSQKRDASDFAGFSPVFDIIQQVRESMWDRAATEPHD